MGYQVRFTDNESISAEQLNAIQSELGEGVEVSEAFEDDIEYSVDKLNDICSGIVTAGVSTGLTCSYTSGKIRIAPGLAYFSDGMQIKVDEEGVELTACEGKSYVYLYQSSAQQLALPMVSETAKENTSGQEYIPLCEVENGVVTDKRTWCKSKIALAAGNTLYERSTSLSHGVYTDYQSYKVIGVDLGDDAFTFAEFDTTFQRKDHAQPNHHHGIRGFTSFSPDKTYGDVEYTAVGGAFSLSLKKNGSQVELWVHLNCSYMEIESGTLSIKAS